jgi:hypothetical protein
VLLGGSFHDAYLKNKHRAVGMYRRIRSELSFERAVLEVMRGVGWLAQPRYERLIEHIGESVHLQTVPITRVHSRICAGGFRINLGRWR